ncbi:hypothetical protein FB446DRAFT_811256 [Lentinula raphanica]|nr:hypothetical protein FB446DRAFT_811256 [Lentinula raphanica]
MLAKPTCRCGAVFEIDQIHLRSYKCDECFDSSLYCAACIVDIHQRNPLHIVQVWNGTFFESSELSTVGLVIHLGPHSATNPCWQALNHKPRPITIIGVQRIHSAFVKFCACEAGSNLDRQQLLAARLFPATSTHPQTAATFDFLNFFQILSFMSKASVTEYYQTLERVTNNSGTFVPPNRLREVFRMIREWRFLMTLKRSGQGHNTEGVLALKPGSLAVRCLPCAHPGINAPAVNDPEYHAKECVWLYKRFEGLDANFRCTRLNVSSVAKDPSFNQGCAFFCDDRRYQNHLWKMSGKWPNESSDCNDHDAIKLANKRGEKNLAVTGIAMASCTRHECILPQSVADLRLGEEYIIMDYVLLQSLQLNCPKKLTISYDIMCQFSKKLHARFDSYGSDLALPAHVEATDLQLLIPKFHLMGHQDSCRQKFAFGYARKTGRTDGEGVERVWSEINLVAGSTKKMGPGARWDLMDDHWNDRNHRKRMTLASSMFNKATHAAEQREKFVVAYEELCEHLDEDQMTRWRSDIAAWDEDHTKKNPYVSSIRPLQLAHIRLELAKEDAELARGPTAYATSGLFKQMTPTTLIVQGLELEELQRRLIFDYAALGNHPTSLQLAKIVERSTSLRTRIQAWISVQALYMPNTTVLRSGGGTQPGSVAAAGDIPLLLPSAVFDAGETCDARLIDIEWRLRFAAAHDEIEKIRKNLLSRTSVLNYKRRYGHGQRQGTRSASILDALDSKINASASRYQVHYDMLSRYSRTLGKVVGWQDSLKPLKKEDLHQPNGDLDGGVPNTKYVSWIWLTTHEDVSNHQNVADCLGVTFCKARARALEWQEECIFLQEEMRRVLVMLEFEAVEWEARRYSKVPGDDDNVGFEGRVAYASRQASIRRDLAKVCKRKWEGLDYLLASGPGGIALNDSNFAFVE